MTIRSRDAPGTGSETTQRESAWGCDGRCPANRLVRALKPGAVETGFRRHGVSPPAAGLDAELVEAVLPAGAVISYTAPVL
jgi:hypothetical protein